MFLRKDIFRPNKQRSRFPKVLLCLYGGASLLTMPCFAYEQVLGFYTGFGISANSAKDGGASSTAVGLTISGGYDFSKYFGSEISLFNIGDHKELGMEGNGLSVGAIGYYPFTEKFSLLGELGYMSVDIEIDETQIATLQDGNDSSIFYSFGLRYDFNKWGVSLKNSVVDLDADMNIVSVQVRYHF